jgi:hypothetical protein
VYIDQIQISPTAGRNAEQVPQDFFYSRVLEKQSENFEELDLLQEIGERFNEMIEEQEEKITEEIEGFGGSVSQIVQNILLPKSDISISARRGLPRYEGVTTAKYTGDITDNPVITFVLQQERRGRHRRLSEMSGRFRIGVIAENKSDGEKFTAHFISEAREIAAYVGGYVEIEGLMTGGEIIYKYFDNKIEEDENLDNWGNKSFQNNFEENVYKEVNKFTGIAANNIEIVRQVGDNPDFDVVALPLGSLGTGYAIEVKDLLQRDNEHVDEAPAKSMETGELRNELIRKPKEYAEQLDLSLVTVAKGLSEQQYNDLQKLTSSSNVFLLNGENYSERLSKILVQKTLSECSEYVFY